MISGLSPSIFIEKDTDLDALNYFERLKEAGGGSVTNQRAYHVLFSQLKRYGLFPEEIIPLDGDNVSGMKVKGYISSLASHTICQDSGIAGQTGSEVFPAGAYVKSTGLAATTNNQILCCGIDANNFDRRNCTLITVVTGNARNNTTKIGGTTGGGTGWGFLALNTSSNANQNPTFIIDGATCPMWSNVIFNVKGIHIGVGSSAGSFWYSNGRKIRSNSTLPTSGNFSTNQVRVYPSNTGVRVSMQMYYRRSLTDAECILLNQLITAFETLRGRPVYKDININLSCWGDSLTFGFSGPGTQITTPYPTQLVTKRSWVSTEGLTTSRNVGNRGVSGKTAADFITDLSTDVFNIKSGAYNPNVTNVYIVWFGTNDLGNLVDTAATTKGRLDSICTTLKAIGSNVKIIVCNLFPDATGYTGFTSLSNFNSQAPSFNTLLAADSNYTNGTLADAVADVSGVPNDVTNRVDSLHPTNTGAGLVADAVITQLTALGLQ